MTPQISDNQTLQTDDRSLALRQASQILTGERGLKLANYEEMYRFAKAVAQSKFKPYPDWSEVDCFICLQKGAEVGMTPMQSLESIYIVNNRATLFGDAPKGLIESSGLMLDYDQYEEGKPFDDDYKWVVTSLRKGRSKPLVTTYSVADAKLAKLWGKTGPWTNHPKRMLLFRARGFNLRDNFADVLKGFAIGELIDEESVEGFEHAKLAAAKVVEPNFGSMVKETQEPSPGVASSSEEVPRPRRGRPPKAQPVQTPTSPETHPEEPPKAEPAKVEPSSPQPETPATNVQAGPETSFFGPARSTPRAEVVRRLNEAKIPQEKYLEVLLAFGYLDCDLGDITMGNVSLRDISDKDLELTLKNWPTVLKELGLP